MLYENEVTKTKNAYFLVWTTHGTVKDNITFHQELWESMKSSFQRLNRGFYLSSIFQSKGVA